jgi:hypothetical protein
VLGHVLQRVVELLVLAVLQVEAVEERVEVGELDDAALDVDDYSTTAA